jgi:AraC-like DNA-binding protein
LPENEKYYGKYPQKIIKTPDSVTKRTFFYVLEAGRAETNSDLKSISNYNNAFLIGVVTEGKCRLTINGKSFNLNDEECFFIDCTQPHSYKKIESYPCKLMIIHFDGSTSKQYYEYFIMHSQNVFKSQLFERIIAEINGIIRAYESNDANADAIASQHIVGILTCAVIFECNSDKFNVSLKEKLMAVNEYINEYFVEDLKLDYLSEKFDISKFYLEREFKKMYGRTIFQQIINARISYGKKLLRFSNKTVEEISQLCGFNDQSYFARQFKKSENLTCFAYRKMWR